MSVHEDLSNLLGYVHTDVLDASYPAELSLDEIAKAILGRHAHELAEKIRNDSWSRRDQWGRYKDEAREAGQCHGADLIDPEVD